MNAGGVLLEESLPVAGVAFEHLGPLGQFGDRLHPAGPRRHDRAAAVVGPQRDEPLHPATDPPQREGGRDVGVAGRGEQRDPRAAGAAGDDGRREVEVPEEAGECVGLHRRLGVPGETDVRGAGVGAVPDQHAIAALGQGERQFPDAR